MKEKIKDFLLQLQAGIRIVLLVVFLLLLAVFFTLIQGVKFVGDLLLRKRRS